MLNLITKSQIRQRIILLFIYNPDKKYYINEIAKLVKTSAGTAQRELRILVKNGFLIKEKNANLVYCRLNGRNPLLPEIKSIIDKTIGLKHILKTKLEELKKIEFAFLFGSYVTGDFKADSDIDLYVVGDVKEDEAHKKIQEAERDVRREINYHLAAREEFKRNLKKSFFHNEILKNYSLIIGDETKFRKFVGRIA